MGAGLNIESLLRAEESEITLFFYQNWYFYIEDIVVHQSDLGVLTY